MAFDLDALLVVGIATRAHFDLDEEDYIFKNQGIEAFREFQRTNENEVLKQGTAFPLVKALLL